jgi:hypothetical protein
VSGYTTEPSPTKEPPQAYPASNRAKIQSSPLPTVPSPCCPRVAQAGAFSVAYFLSICSNFWTRRLRSGSSLANLAFK